MKKITQNILIGLTIGTGLLFSTDIHPVGAIMNAIIDEEAFQSQMGEEWVLMDGRPISKSDDLAKYLDGVTNCDSNKSQICLPDARGKFLRMLDDSSRDKKERIKNGDPEDNRILGSFQEDAFETHTHTFNGARNYNSDAGGHARAKPSGQKRTTNANSDGGKEETRPKNIAVNFFIKIRKCSSKNCK